MSCETLPAWAIQFFEAAISHICKCPQRRAGVWKFKRGEITEPTPKELDKLLHRVNTRMLKMWVNRYVSAAYPVRPILNDALKEHALQCLVTEVASYKRGASSRNTQSKLRSEYGRGKQERRNSESAAIASVQYTLELSRNLLEHVRAQEITETAVTDACKALSV